MLFIDNFFAIAYFFLLSFYDIIIPYNTKSFFLCFHFIVISFEIEFLRAKILMADRTEKHGFAKQAFDKVRHTIF